MTALADVLDVPNAMAEAYRAMYTLGPQYAKRLGAFGGFAYGPDGEVHHDEVLRVREAGNVVVLATPEAMR
jgi:hypothetical protein